MRSHERCATLRLLPPPAFPVSRKLSVSHGTVGKLHSRYLTADARQGAASGSCTDVKCAAVLGGELCSERGRNGGRRMVSASSVANPPAPAEPEGAWEGATRGNNNWETRKNDVHLHTSQPNPCAPPAFGQVDKLDSKRFGSLGSLSLP